MTIISINRIDIKTKKIPKDREGVFILYYCVTNYQKLGLKNTSLLYHSFQGSEILYSMARLCVQGLIKLILRNWRVASPSGGLNGEKFASSTFWLLAELIFVVVVAVGLRSVYLLAVD